MHRHAANCSRTEIVRQVTENDETLRDFGSYVPIGHSVKKLNRWAAQAAEILYLTSRKKEDEVDLIRSVLLKNGFPEGKLLFRNEYEEYKDIAEKVLPRILIEDDCESIGGADEMTITHINPELKRKIKSIIVKEFGGIDHLPDNIEDLILDDTSY